jgi:HAD superfamily hydrolase (TIGR01490 family)
MTTEPGHRQAAFFDVDGTLTKTTVVHHYAYFRRRLMSPAAGRLWSAAFLVKCLYYVAVDVIDRNKFNKVFYRGYRGLSANDIIALAEGCHRDVIVPRRFREAAGCVAAHRHAGRKIVLVTGSLDFIIAPLARDLGADELLAARLEQSDGRFTGRLEHAPIAGAEKARVVRRYADDRKIDLQQSFAYGDSIADLAMLETVGHPQAVNPDRRLAIVARGRRWPVHRWTTQRSAAS